MAQEQAPPAGPDLTQGIALTELAGGKLVGHVGDEEVLLVHSGAEAVRRRRPLHATTTGPSPKELWSEKPYGVPGIMPVSTCAPARPCAHRP